MATYRSHKQREEDAAHEGHLAELEKLFAAISDPAERRAKAEAALPDFQKLRAVQTGDYASFFGQEEKAKAPPPVDLTDEVIRAVADAETRRLKLGRTRKSMFGQPSTLLGG